MAKTILVVLGSLLLLAPLAERAHAESLRFAYAFDGVTIPCDGVWRIGAAIAVDGHVARAYLDVETAYPAPLAAYPYTHATIQDENGAILAEVHTATPAANADRSFGSDSVPVTIVYIGGVCYPPAILSNLYGNVFVRSTP